MLAIGIFNIPVFARVTRSAALPVWQRDFILVARLAGKSDGRISREHVLPNIMPLLLVQAAIQFSLAILAESGLAYIGLGATTATQLGQDARRWPDTCLTGTADHLCPRWGHPHFSAVVQPARRTVEASPYRRGRRLTVLETKNLGVTIGGNDVVCDLNISLKAGRVLGICGESGAGKSMAAMAIAGLLPDDADRRGQITLAGRRLDQCDDNALSNIRGTEIGMIFQEPLTALNPLLTIGDQVADVFRQHRNLDRHAALDEAAETLQLVGLPSAEIPLSRLPDELSGGQRQRVVIAMAIALGPQLLIADEPTTALDATTQAEILDLLQQLVRDENLALLLITHDLGVMARMADDLIVMDGGNVIEAGDVTMLDGGLHHPRAIALAAASRLDAPAKACCRGNSGTVNDLDNVSYHYQGRGYRAAAQQALSDVSFSIDEGEIIGIVGASGSGKTTLSRLMLGLLNPSSARSAARCTPAPVQCFRIPMPPLIRASVSAVSSPSLSLASPTRPRPTSVMPSPMCWQRLISTRPGRTA